MKFEVPKKLRSYVRTQEVECHGGLESVHEEADFFLLALGCKDRREAVSPDFYCRVADRAPDYMPFFLEQLVPFPVLTIPATEMSDWGAVTEASKVAKLACARFVLTKKRALRGVFGRGEAAVAGMGGTAVIDLALALCSLPFDDSWVQATLLPSDLCAFQTSFVGEDEFLGLSRIPRL